MCFALGICCTSAYECGYCNLNFSVHPFNVFFCTDTVKKNQFEMYKQKVCVITRVHSQ